MAKFRISWVQVMAILALIGILLGVVGTAFLYSTTPVTAIGTPVVSAEVMQ
jgi:hypothetical protein